MELIEAVCEGNVKQVRKLIPLVDINYQDADGSTALYGATKDNNLQIVKELLKANVDVNLSNNYGYTPLINAVELKQVYILCMLLKYGANVNKADLLGWTPLMWAARMGNVDATRILVRGGANVDDLNALGIAIVEDKVDVIQEFINCGVSRDTASQALVHAVMHGQINAVRVLLSHADVNYVAGKPLLIAVQQNNKDIIRLLRDSGARMCSRQK